jgi:hypothetical protein
MIGMPHVDSFKDENARAPSRAEHSSGLADVKHCRCEGLAFEHVVSQKSPH